MKHAVVAPRHATPVPGSSSGGRSSLHLPDDVVDEQVRRVWLFSGVSAFMWAFGMTMDGLVFPATLGVSVPRTHLIVDGIATVSALAIFLALRFAPISNKRIVRCMCDRLNSARRASVSRMSCRRNDSSSASGLRTLSERSSLWRVNGSGRTSSSPEATHASRTRVVSR